MTKTFLGFFLVKSRDCDVTLANVTKMEKTGFLIFGQKYILSEGASEKEQSTENRLSMRHVWAQLWDFKNISVRPPDLQFFLKNDCSGIFFNNFIQKKLKFWYHKPFIVD